MSTAPPIVHYRRDEVHGGLVQFCSGVGVAPAGRGVQGDAHRPTHCARPARRSTCAPLAPGLASGSTIMVTLGTSERRDASRRYNADRRRDVNI